MKFTQCGVHCEGGGKEGQGPKQKAKKEKDEKGKGKGKAKDVAATAKDDKDDKAKPDKEEEAWMVMIMDEMDSEEDECTTYPVNDDLSFPYLFDGVDETLDDGDAVMYVDQQISANPDEEVKTGLEAAYLVGTAETRSAEVDLYDSGTTRHMSGFFHRIFNYVETKPVPIITADKRPFHAIGKGDMYVYLPNRDKSNSRILLRDVLYAPDMGITLVSISRIAGNGATVVFTGNVC